MNRKTSKPFVSRSLDNGKYFNISFNHPVKFNINFSYLAKFKLFIIHKFKSCLRKSKGIIPMNILESWVTSFISFFNSIKESIKGLNDFVINILKNLGMNRFKIRINYLNVWKDIIKLNPIGKSYVFLINISFIFKHGIIQISAIIKNIIKSINLLSRRIQSIFVAFCDFHFNDIISKYFNIYIHFGFQPHLYPTLKRGVLRWGKPIIKNGD